MKRKVFITVAIAMSLAVAVSLTVATLVFRQYEVASVQERLETLAVDLSARDLSDGVSFTLADYTVTPKDRFDYAEDAQQRNLLYGTFTDANGENFVIWKAEPTFHDVLAHRWELFAVCAAMILLSFLCAKPVSDAIIRILYQITKYLQLLFTNEDIDDKTQDEYRNFAPFVADIEMSKNRLEYAIATLKKNETLRREFTANVSHELKTPLTSINGYAELIAGGMAEGEQAKKFAEIIVAEGQRLLLLIDQTIQLSRYDEGRVDKSGMTELRLDQLAAEAINRMKGAAAESKIKLKSNLYPATIRGDSRRIADVLANLISNAVKYNKPGGSVLVKTKENAEGSYLIVSDDGIGIAPEHHERIFERFFVVNKARNYTSGTGLGLSLIKHIVAMHGGTIQLESALGKGSTFTIHFPKVPDEKTEPPLPENTEELATSPPPESESPFSS